MSPPRDPREALEDIESAALKAIEFVAGMDLAAFSADDKTTFAVIRALEIVGEAAKRIPPTIRQRHPDVPWRAMSGIRDKLIHDYVNVNLEVLWRTVADDLPDLLPRIRRILDEPA